MMFSRGSSWYLNHRLNYIQIQEIELNVCQSIAASNFPNLFILTSIWSKRSGISSLVLFIRIKTELYNALGQHQFYLRCSQKNPISLHPSFMVYFVLISRATDYNIFGSPEEQKKKKWYRNLVWTNHMKKRISPTPIADVIYRYRWLLVVNDWWYSWNVYVVRKYMSHKILVAYTKQ